jgi:pectate lyase
MTPVQETAQRFIDTVTTHVDQVEVRCRRQHGTHQGPLLADGVDPVSGEPMRWEDCILSSLSCQQNHLRSLVGLSALTGEPRHRAIADEWIQYALQRLQDPASGLLRWGGHETYDLQRDEPMGGNHEMKCVFPFYRFLHQVNPAALNRFVCGFWQQHVNDWSTLLFNRHGEYTAPEGDAVWSQTYSGGPVPIIQNTYLSFVNTGSDLIAAGVMLHVLDGAQQPLTWALRLLQRYEDIRDPQTGLAGYQFNHRDPCRVRQSFYPPLGQREDVNETTVLTSGVIGTRYGKAALAWMNLYEELGVAAGAPLLDVVSRDLAALARYSFDADRGAFIPVLHDGTRLAPEQAQEGVGYCPPSKLHPVPANGMLFLSYARAYHLSGREEFLQTAGQLAVAMGWGQWDGDDLRADAGRMDAALAQSAPSWGRVGMDSSCLLMGMLELFRASDDGRWLDAALALAQRILETATVGGLVVTGSPGHDGCISVDGSLPPVLLQLAAAALDSQVTLPRFYPNSTSFDPKVIVARRQR